MGEETLLVERRGAVGILVMNRPEKRNALTPGLLFRLRASLEDLARDADIRAVVLRGAGGKAFCAGYDIGVLPAGPHASGGEASGGGSPLEAALNAVLDYPYPVIAMLNGDAFGAGCELAVCCDLRLAAADARIGIPAARMGLVYPVAGLLRLVGRIGLANAKEILLTGRAYAARRAQELGIVNTVAAREDLERLTFETAEEIAANAPLALKGLKRILNRIARTAALSPEDAAEAERLVQASFDSCDLKEARAAFAEKRKPVFRGR